jgi:hypothetical protein
VRRSKLAAMIAGVMPTIAFIPFNTGLDLVTPVLQVQPGAVRDCLNWAVDLNGGYYQPAGYERYDGRPRPSDASYMVLYVDITGEIEVGDDITGATSGATATVIAINDTYLEDTPFLVVTRVVGEFDDGEDLEVAAVVEASITNDPIAVAPTSELNAIYKNLAADEYRADITAVPGEGKVRGVWWLNGTVYAVRDNEGATAAALYRASGSGWVAVPLGLELAFTAGGSHATGSVTLTGGGAGSVDMITVDGVNIMSGAVPFNTSLNQTATDVATNINSHTSSPDYTAQALGAVITITASSPGAAPNDFAVVVTATTITTSKTDMSGGGEAIEEGDTITGATSGATATVTRVALQSGSWAAGTAAGRLIFASDTGTFQAESLNITGYAGIATIGGDASAITLLPGGRFETIRTSFQGQADERIYGCDGVNRGFEFDGTVFAPITTGMPTDAPTHVAEFKKHLFFSFAASAQHSGLGEPFTWTAITGAAELATGDNITAFAVQPGSQGTMAIFCRNRTHVLYGSSAQDWNLVSLKREVGAYAYTTQELGLTVLYDDRGIANLETTDQYGNFKGLTLSRMIQPFLNQRRGSATASCISRDVSQYRLFFSDQFALYVTMDGQQVRGILQQFFQHKVECITSQEEVDGSETIYFGSDDGFVYQLDKGTSHDGAPIERRLGLHFFDNGSPRILKTFKDVAIEVKGIGFAKFQFGYQLGYNLPEYTQPLEVTVQTEFNQVYWDAFTWEAFVWDGVTLSPVVRKLDGSAQNIALSFRSYSDYYSPLSFSGANLRYNTRRQLRS